MEEFSGGKKVANVFQKLNLIAVILGKKQTKLVYGSKMRDDKSHTNEKTVF